jgi:hypothetical protein
MTTRLSPSLRWALAPFALALLMALHAGPLGAPGLFVLLHIAALPLLVLTSVAGWRLLAGVPGPLATGARVGFVGFGVVYSLYDLVAGVYAGALVVRSQSVSDPVALQTSLDTLQALLASPWLPLLGTLGAYTWALALLLALLALWEETDEPSRRWLLLVPAALALLLDHPGWPGVVAFGGFAAVVRWRLNDDNLDNERLDSRRVGDGRFGGVR